MASTLFTTSLQFFSVWESEPNQTPSNLTGPSVQCPTTLDDNGLFLQMPRRKLMDLSLLTFAPATASYLRRASST
uniref:Uncharacterized protein n=1 Tax=Octopus bimaculoides TaxID=37653 RepID=A0A0L8G2F8_OCTBM